MSLVRQSTKRLAVIATLAVAVLATTTHWHRALAATWDYWLTRPGGEKIIKCDGNTTGAEIKLANRDSQWVYIDGIASCKDDGSQYAITVRYLKVTINDQRNIGDIERDQLAFDWIGLELFKENASRTDIDWIHHQERPIQGALARTATRPIYFGNIQFTIPKSAAQQAKRLRFYLTAQGIPFVFEVL